MQTQSNLLPCKIQDDNGKGGTCKVRFNAKRLGWSSGKRKASKFKEFFLCRSDLMTLALQEVILRRQLLKTFGTQKADTIAIVALGTCVNVGSVTPNPHPEPASGYRTHPQICMKSKVRSSSPPTRRHTRKTSSASMPNDIHSKARIEGTSRARPQQAFWVAAGEPQACGER